MTATVKIAPSILTADLTRLEDEILAVERAGVDYMHLDVMDGHFVPPITFGALLVASIRRITTLPLDVHLMIERPQRHVAAFAEAGATIINVHVEACKPDLPAALADIRAAGCRAGVSVNPETPLTAIDRVLDQVDQVMIMGVNPGWGGQPLIPGTLDKVRALREILAQRALSPDIELDGGVKIDNCADCAQAGANVLVAGSVVYNDSGAADENVRLLRAKLASA